MSQTLTQEGIAAFKSGDKVRAQMFLREATARDPEDIQAWLWLAGAAEGEQERADCLAQVLKLDPANAQAAKGLAQMVAKGKVSLVADKQETVVSTSAVGVPVGAETLANDRKIPVQQTVEKQLFVVRPSFIPVFVYGIGIGLVILLIMAWMLSIAKGSYLEGVANWIAVFFVLAIFVAIGFGILDRFLIRYTLTTQRLIVERGILGRSKKTIPLQRIQDVSYKQSPVERLLALGDVLVESAGEYGAIRLLDLAHCQRRTEQILHQVERTIQT
jgi:membrane protein YdbS with pleckstrin-like domain